MPGKKVLAHSETLEINVHQTLYINNIKRNENEIKIL